MMMTMMMMMKTVITKIVILIVMITEMIVILYLWRFSAQHMLSCKKRKAYAFLTITPKNKTCT